KLVNVARKTGQLFVCADGCCCGRTEKGFPPLPRDLLHGEWERRRLRNKVHLTLGGCLGPCPLANVIMLLFDGRPLWFHSFTEPGHVTALFDCVEAMLAAGAYLPLPAALADLHFTAFNWEGHRETGDARLTLPVAETAAQTLLFLTQADTDLLALSRIRQRL